MSGAKRSIRANLTRQLVKNCATALLVWVLVLVVGFLLCRAYFSRYVWYGDEPLYPLLSFVNHRFDLVFLVLLGIGALVIFIFNWARTLSYVDMVVQATEQLVADDGEEIALPEELHEVAGRLNAAKLRAAEADRAAADEAQRKNDLLVYLAHDLKTPLTSVIGYLQLLHDEQDITPELRRRYEGVALDRAQRLEDLVNEFFEVARLNLAKSSLCCAPLNIGRMVEQVMFEYRPVMEPKGLTYRVTVDGDAVATCDANKVERLFDNLVRNAVNYSWPNTQVEVGVHVTGPEAKGSAEEGRRLGALPAGVEIRVENRGDTIPADQLERLFDQFYRLSSSRDSDTGGSGLGLAIAKRIVEAHGGTICALSEDGVVTFAVWLPKEPPLQD